MQRTAGTQPGTHDRNNGHVGALPWQRLPLCLTCCKHVCCADGRTETIQTGTYGVSGNGTLPTAVVRAATPGTSHVPRSIQKELEVYASEAELRRKSHTRGTNTTAPHLQTCHQPTLKMFDGNSSAPPTFDNLVKPFDVPETNPFIYRYVHERREPADGYETLSCEKHHITVPRPSAQPCCSTAYRQKYFQFCTTRETASRLPRHQTYLRSATQEVACWGLLGCCCGHLASSLGCKVV